MSELVLLSPLQGWSTPLDEVPDPVFAGRMLGDGLAIDPLGATLYAPCAGHVLTLPDTRHAVTLRTDSGLDVLMHIGIDTVGLGGEGFEAHIAVGQQVRAGEPLISFDLDLLARRVPSVLTPVLLVSSGALHLVQRVEGRPVEVGELLMKWVGGEVCAVDVASPSADIEVLHRSVRVALEHGIHARPAARICAVLKPLHCEVSIRFRGKEANARSATSLMTLGATQNEQVDIHTSGPDAAEALAALEDVLSTPAPSEGLAAPAAIPVAMNERSADRSVGPPCAGAALRGVVASRGMAQGPAAVLRDRDVDVPEAGAGIEHESAELTRARTEVRSAIERSRQSATGAGAEILDAHLALIDDPQLQARALEFLGLGKSAGFAWRSAIGESVQALRALGDARMAERVDDLIDVERRVLRALAGESCASGSSLEPGAILVAESLLPSQLAALDMSALRGICLAAGGATSHVAILAAAAGIPALVALGPAILGVAEGTVLVLDAEDGVVHVDPDSKRLEVARQRIRSNAQRCASERHAAQRECRMADGTRIEVLANLASEADAEVAVGNGAEGCGLLRTEFLFLDRRTAPDEREQRAEYQRIAAALGGRPLTIRTLDIGGDKPIAYLPLPPEDNPALGLRGVRTSLWRTDLLDAQLRAVMGVEPAGQCRVLLPMITDVAEIRAVRARINAACRSSGRSESIEVGVMIETPASALMAETLAREVEFFSIGTNDLTQYTLAMDRGHSELAARLDALHPAVLRLIDTTANAARAQGRRTAVCGGLASDPAAVPILIGLGVHELSCVPSIIPRVKALIGRLTLEQCRERAREALKQESAEAVRALCAATQTHTDEAPSLTD